MSKSLTHEQARMVVRIVESIKPRLSGHPPNVQGAVVADLFAIWLACFHGPDVDALREDLIKAHVKMARELVANYDVERLHKAEALISHSPSSSGSASVA